MEVIIKHLNLKYHCLCFIIFNFNNSDDHVLDIMQDKFHCHREEVEAFSKEQHSAAFDKVILLEVVRSQNKNGHVYGLRHLGNEFVTSSKLEMVSSPLESDQDLTTPRGLEQNTMPNCKIYLPIK